MAVPPTFSYLPPKILIDQKRKKSWSFSTPDRICILLSEYAKYSRPNKVVLLFGIRLWSSTISLFSSFSKRISLAVFTPIPVDEYRKGGNEKSSVRGQEGKRERKSKKYNYAPFFFTFPSSIFSSWIILLCFFFWSVVLLAQICLYRARDVPMRVNGSHFFFLSFVYLPLLKNAQPSTTKKEENQVQKG